MKAKPVIIDVREPFEYATGHVSGALNIPPSALLRGAPQLEAYAKDTPLILYCRSGQRSNTAIQILRSMGYTNLTNAINKEQVEANFL